jgi:hypothetical protein
MHHTIYTSDALVSMIIEAAPVAISITTTPAIASTCPAVATPTIAISKTSPTKSITGPTIPKPAPTTSIVSSIKPGITPSKAPTIVAAVKRIISPVVIWGIPVIIVTGSIRRAVISPQTGSVIVIIIIPIIIVRSIAIAIVITSVVVLLVIAVLIVPLL